MKRAWMRAASAAPALCAAGALLLLVCVQGCYQRRVRGTADRATVCVTDSVRSVERMSIMTALTDPQRTADPVLKLVKSAPATARRCDVITLVYTVTNEGTTAVDGVVITDALTEGLSTADGSSAVRIEVGSIPPGEARRFEVAARAARIGVLGSPAAVTAGPVRVPAEAVTTVVTEPRLALSGVCERAGMHVYTLRNSGNGPAVGAKVTVHLPEGATEPTASDGGVIESGVVSWELGELTAGEARTLTVCFELGQDRLGETHAEAEAECAETVRANCNG